MGGEMILDRLPVVIYIKCSGVEWKIGKLPVGVYPMTVRSRTWKINKYTGIAARRRGYTLLPDFASTAHMVQRETRDAVLCGAVCGNLIAYVAFSRVRTLSTVKALEPFSPQLFESSIQK